MGRGRGELMDGDVGKHREHTQAMVQWLRKRRKRGRLVNCRCSELHSARSL